MEYWGCAGKWILSALVATALLCGCADSRGNNSKDPANASPVAVVKAVRKNLTATLEIASEFLPYQEVNAYAKVSGYIQSLNVDWGTHVKQGQTLAVLEVPELEQQLLLDQAEVHRREHDGARAREELNRVQSSYSVTNLTYERIANVKKSQPGLLSQEEVDEAQGKDREASAGVSAAKEAVAASEQSLAAAQAALDRDRAMYGYSRITAPFSGVVTELDAYKGALLPAGTSSNKGDLPLCRLSQNDLLRLAIPLPERAVPDLHTGEAVAVHVTTLDKTFTGKIARFSDRIATGTRTMYTEVDVPNPKYVLVPGMYATAEIPLRTAQNALVVPVQAVQTAGEDRGSVLVANGENKLERREVTTGLRTPTDIEIVSGLKDGELVVFGEQSQHKAGEPVIPKIVQPEQIETAQAE